MNQDPHQINIDAIYAPQAQPDPPGRTRRVIIWLAAGLSVGLIAVGGLVLALGLWADRSASPAGAPSTAAPTAVTIANGQPAGWKLAFEETFDDNSRNWSVHDEEDEYGVIKSEIKDGAFRWQMSSKGDLSWASWPMTKDIFGDAYISVDVQVTDSKPGDDVTYGIDFRRANPHNFYSFEVTDSGRYELWVLDRGDYYQVIDTTSSRQVHSHAVNTLGVLTVGTHFVLYINGQRVDAYDAELPTPGRVGVVVDLLDAGQEATIEFDNLKVYTP